MTPVQIIRAAIPAADEWLCEQIIWGRTPFPCGPVNARDIYQAAYRWQRAVTRGRKLCELCDRVAERNDCVCERCAEAIKRART